MSRPAELSGTLWPIHLKPLDDELLSSWMIRLARAYDVKPVWFWRLFWPVDFREVDVDAPGGLVDLLAGKTATPFQRALETTLTAIAQEHSVIRTIRYCDLCMAEDPQPYFRRRWRLRSFLLCEKHGVPLQNGCPEWGHDLMPEVARCEDSILWCSRCRSKVRVTREPFAPRRPADQVLDWQKRLWVLLCDDRPGFGIGDTRAERYDPEETHGHVHQQTRSVGTALLPPRTCSHTLQSERISPYRCSRRRMANRFRGGIGSTEEHVRDLYGLGLQVERHPYDDDGKYRILRPGAGPYRGYELLFETDGKVVTSFRAGTVEAMTSVEGCC